MYYSFILPIFNESQNIIPLYTRIKKVAKKLKKSHEMIFINDGSFDDSREILLKLHQKDPYVKIISFSRNFGHQTAVSAGLRYSSGQSVAVLDADLQDPPEVLPAFFKKLHAGYDVVYAVRKDRKEHLVLTFMYGFFYRVLKSVANIEIPLDSGDFCVMSRRVVTSINSLPERNRFVRGVRSWVGFRQTGMSYAREARYAGDSKYTISKLFKLAFDGIFSFSYVPLQLMFYLGMIALLVSIIGSIVAIYMKFFTTAYSRVPGFATTIILIMFVGGVQLFSIGVLGEYLRRIYDEVKQRPQYVIESMVGFEDTT